MDFDTHTREFLDTTTHKTLGITWPNATWFARCFNIVLRYNTKTKQSSNKTSN